MARPQTMGPSMKRQRDKANEIIDRIQAIIDFANKIANEQGKD